MSIENIVANSSKSKKTKDKPAVANITTTGTVPQTGKTTGKEAVRAVAKGVSSIARVLGSGSSGKEEDINIAYNEPTTGLTVSNVTTTGTVPQTGKTTGGMIRENLYGAPLQEQVPGMYGEKAPTWEGTPSSFQLTTQGVSDLPSANSFLETVLIKPYREDVAPRLAATMLVMNPEWRKQNAELVGDTSLLETFFLGSPAYWKAIEDSRNLKIGPGRALVYGLGSAWSGATGEQTAVEQIDWENQDTIQQYFNQGAAKFWSGLADFGFNSVDPAFLTARAGGNLYKLGFNVKITPETQAAFVSSVYKGAEGIGPGAPFFKLVEDAAKTGDTGALERHKLLINNPRAAQYADYLVEAYKSGGNLKVADLMAFSAGDRAAFERITKQADDLSIKLQVMEEKSNSLKAIMEDINKRIGSDGPATETVDGLEQLVIPNLNASAQVTQREIDLANKIGVWLPGFDNKIQKLQSDLNIAQMISGTRIQETGQRIGGVLGDIDRTFTNIPGKLGQIVSIRNEQRRANMATRSNEAYWGISSTTLSTGEKVLQWTNPSARLNELPANIASFSGPGASRVMAEVDARIKNRARAVGMSGEKARELRTTYPINGSKYEQYVWFNNFEADTTLDIISKYVDISSLGPKETEILRTLVTEMTNATRRAQTRAISQLLRDERFSTIYNNEKVIIPQFKQIIDDLAQARALDAGRDIPDASDFKVVIDNLLNDTPVMESQVPGIHIGIDAGLINEWARENKLSIQYMVNRLLRNPEATKNNIKQSVELLEKEVKGLPISWTEDIGGTGREIFDLVKHGYMTYIDSIWKPITLLSFRYTTRNVAEGLGRVVALGLEYHDERGYGYADMFKDYVSLESLARYGRNREARRNIRRLTSRSKAGTRASEFDINFKNATKDMTSAQRDAQLTFVNSNDGMAVAINDLLNQRETLFNYMPGKQTQDAYNELKSAFDYIFNSPIPQDVDTTFVKLMLDSKPLDAWEYAMGRPAKASVGGAPATWQQRVDDRTLLRSIQHIENRVNDGLKSIGELNTTQYAGLDTLFRNTVSAANNITEATNAAKTAVLNLMDIKGTLENVIINRSKVLDAIERGNEGLIEIIPGVFIPDAYSGAVGQIMKGQVSAAASTSSTVLNARRNITGDMLGRNSGLTDIMPTKINLEGNGYVTNPVWATSHAEYVNTKFANSEIAKKIFAGKKDEDIYKWIMSKDALAQKTRKELELTLDNYPSAPDGKTKWFWVIRRTRDDIETQLPLVDKDGISDGLLYLREKAAKGDFTPEDSLAIPEILRVPVKGIDVINGDRNLFKAYRSVINSLFDKLATRPEDALVRHPFYLSVYRNEARHLARMAKSSGIDPNEIGPRIAERAHQVAYQQVMERLYSVERYTTIAGVMKYMSPFYMAQQNSARFWLGAAARRPQLPVRMLQIWNAPNQAWDVRDKEGKQVEYNFPWQAQGETLYVPIPEKYKKYYGGGDFFTLNKTSADLVFQGQPPMYPQFSAPVFDASIGTLIWATRGTKYDPDAFLTRIGAEPNFFIDYIAPYYRPLPGAGPINKAFQSAIPTSSWMRSLLTASVGLTGFAASKGYANAFASRLDAAYRNEINKLAESGRAPTPEEDAAIYKNAAGQATISLLWESILAFGAPIVPVKIKRNVEVDRMTLTRMQKELGYDEGSIAFAEAQAGLSDLAFQSIAASASDNKFGLYATPETMRNLKDYADLNDTAQRYFDSAGKSNESRVIGYFMNEGNPEDFSTLQNEGLYVHKIAGKPVKIKVTDEAANKANIQVSAGWKAYFDSVDLLDADFNASKASGNGMTKKQYDTIKKNIRLAIEKDYPIWAENNGFTDADKQVRNQKIIYLYLNDEKFVQKESQKNSTVKIADIYFNGIRPLLVRDLGSDKLTDREDISNQLAQIVSDLKRDYPDKVSTSFIEQFIANDKLIKINTENPLGGQ